MRTTQTTPAQLPNAIVFPRLGLRIPPPTAGAPGWPPAGRVSLVAVAMIATTTLLRVGWALEPGAPAGWAVVLSAGLAAWLLYPQPQTGFRVLGSCRAHSVAAGDWLADGFWAVRVASCTPTPYGVRLNLADNDWADLRKGDRVRLLQPLGEVTTATLPLPARIRSVVVLELLLWGWMLAAPYVRTFSVWLVRFLLSA
jgi:hypothetical protein